MRAGRAVAHVGVTLARHRFAVDARGGRHALQRFADVHRPPGGVGRELCERAGGPFAAPVVDDVRDDGAQVGATPDQRVEFANGERLGDERKHLGRARFDEPVVVERRDVAFEGVELTL